MTLTELQRQAVLDLIEQIPWSDARGALETVDEGLAFALDLTATDFRFWHTKIEPLGYEDEYDRTLVSELPPEWKLALVARLLRTIAISYGLSTDYGGGINGQPCLHETHAATPTTRRARDPQRSRTPRLSITYQDDFKRRGATR